jgi:hypothetical protein
VAQAERRPIIITSEPTKFKKMTANELIQRLIHIPPGQEIGLFVLSNESAVLGLVGKDDDLAAVIWDELEEEKGDEVKTATAEHIAVVETANENEKAVLRVAYQFLQQNQRKGQALMNALRMKQPELYDILSGTDKDPFYNDDKLQDALSELGFKIRRFW